MSSSTGRVPRRRIDRLGGWAAAALLAACSSPPPAVPATGGALAAAESLYLDLREVHDRIGVARSAGRTAAGDGTPLAALARRQRRPDCEYDPAAIATVRNGLDSLRGRLYACYGWAQSHVAVGTDTTDRLSVLGALGRTENPAERRR